METFLDGRVRLHAGDCLDSLREIPDNSVDSAVTDPPYFLTSIVKRFGGKNAAHAQGPLYRRLSGGFMGRKWDAPPPPPIDPSFANWFAGFADGEGCFSVHKKNVNGYETYDCQFSISLRADDKAILVEIQNQLGGIGTIADRPAREGNPQARFCVSSQADCIRLRDVLSVFPLRAKKARDFEIWSHALDSWLSHESGGSWSDVAYYRDSLMAVKKFGSTHHPDRLFHYRWASEVYRTLKPGGHLLAFGAPRNFGFMQVAIAEAGFEIRDVVCWLFGTGFPKSHNVAKGIRKSSLHGSDDECDAAWEGWGTALKPAFEPIIMARKPLIGTIATNVLTHRTGAINIDACRVPSDGGAAREGESSQDRRYDDRGATNFAFKPGPRGGAPQGRWPANVITDGSEEVIAAFPETTSGTLKAGTIRNHENKIYGKGMSAAGIPATLYDTGGDSGSAARFFYAAKASAEERAGSRHPTVKPRDLIRYLIRLVTPPHGLVLDPFAGTGTTAEAAYYEGMSAILMEAEPEYHDDIRRRMSLVLAGPEERERIQLKASGRLLPPDDLPLFSEAA